MSPSRRFVVAAICSVALLQTFTATAVIDVATAIGNTVYMTCDYSDINLEFGDVVLWKKVDEHDASKYTVFAAFGDVEDSWADHYSMQYNGTETVLSIKVQSVAHTGIYRCEIQRGRDVIMASSFKVKISDPPKVECLGSVTVPLEASTVLTCMIRSSLPLTSVTWLRNKKLIYSYSAATRKEKTADPTATARIQESDDHLRATLGISKVTDGSYGTYTLNVSTVGGSATANITMLEAEKMAADATNYLCSDGSDRFSDQLNCDSAQQKRLLARRLYNRHCRIAGTGSAFYCWKLALQLQVLSMRLAGDKSLQQQQQQRG